MEKSIPMINKLYIILVLLLVAACATVPDIVIEQETYAPTSTLSESRESPTASATIPTETKPTEQPAVNTTSALGMCGPLEGYSSEMLLAAISNPFNPPAQGSDLPHQAIDIAVIQNGIALAGERVFAILRGVISAVITDRFPYGNAILVETAFEDLPIEFHSALPWPTPAPTMPPHPSLTCPQPTFGFVGGTEGRSLYLLYAHMQESTNFLMGEEISCGAAIGRIGQSGNALNPHLHLEARVGPSGARFMGIAHYDSRAKPEEMSSYCLWRVSNLFQLIDPTVLLRSLP